MKIFLIFISFLLLFSCSTFPKTEIKLVCEAGDTMRYEMNSISHGFNLRCGGKVETLILEFGSK